MQLAQLRPRSDPELSAEKVAEALVGEECFRDVALGGEGLDQKHLSAFSERGQAHQFAPAALGSGQLRPAEAQAGRAVGAEGP